MSEINVTTIKNENADYGPNLVGYSTVTGDLNVTGTITGNGSGLNSIPNGALDNSTISGISLGSNLTTLTRGTYLTGSDYNGSTAQTWAVDATSANTVSKVVVRDGSGNFSAGTITATLNGSATNITLADNSSDTTCFPVFALDATGNQAPKTDASVLTYNASDGTLSATNVNSTSDINLKKDIEVITDATDLIKQLNGVRFTWKANDRKSLGVIAQEVEELFPELISERTDTGTKSVNYNGLVGVLIEAVKELSARVEELEDRLES